MTLGVGPTMTLKTDEVTKKIELPNGAKVERKATFSTPRFSNNEEMLEALDGQAYLWASHGLAEQARRVANGRLLGGSGGDPVLKKALRQFKIDVESISDIMDLDKAKATQLVLGKPKNEAVRQHFANIASGEAELVLDFSSGHVPAPRWFKDALGAEGVEMETEEDEEGEEATEG